MVFIGRETPIVAAGPEHPGGATTAVPGTAGTAGPNGYFRDSGLDSQCEERWSYDKVNTFLLSAIQCFNYRHQYF